MRLYKKILVWNDWLAFIALSLVWGSSYILIKKALIAFDPVQVASLRIIISTIAFLPVFLIHIKKIDFKNWYKYLIVGLMGGGFPPFLFALAQTKVSSSLAGALNSLTPIFTLIFGVMLFRNNFDIKKTSGVTIGLAGAIILILSSNGELSGGVFYSLLIVAATIFYGLGANLIKLFFSKHNVLTLTATTFMMFGPFAIFILLSTDFFYVMKTDDQAMFSLLAVTTLALFSTVIASVIFFKLVQKSNPVFAASVSYAAPFVAMLWGSIDDEYIGYLMIFSLLIIIYGVYLTRNNK